jgi:succinoglycan biosynthesis transport protein ExoP
MAQVMGDADDLERSESKLPDVIAAMLRRRKPILLALGAGMVTTLLLVLLLPPRYQSTGTILIEQQELPADLVRSTVTSYADQRVQVISQRVMTTQNLLGIIRRYDLYLREQSREPREQLIQRMRDDIQFKMISADVIDPRSGSARKATIAFTVSYTSPSIDTAAKIANELTTLYLNENLTERNRLAQEASGFLQSEADRLNGQIRELDTKLVSFKQKHQNELPELTQLNMQQLDRTEQALHEAESRRSSLNQQLLFLDAQFAQIKPESTIFSDTGERIQSPMDRLKSLRARLASATALYEPDHPDVVRMKREIAGLEQQTGKKAVPVTNDLRRNLEQAQGELADLAKKYSPDHPDVQRLQRQVAHLQAELAKAPEMPAAPDAAATPGSAVAAAPAAVTATAAASTTPPDNPVYMQLSAQLDALRSDLKANDATIERLKALAADYQRKIAVSPEVEKEYRELTRDYEGAQLKYRDMSAKEMEAQVAQNLESDRKGERFTLIEPPLPPEEPVSPNRPLIMILGSILSIALAIGLAVFLESVDGTVRGRKDLTAAFSAPMLATVPRITTAADIALGRRRVKYALGTIAVVLMATIAAVHVFYRPLDVLWFAAMRRLGL